MVEWNRAFAPPVPFEISVNLSGRQFTRIDLVRMVTDSLEGTGLNADCLKLEITASALMENAQRSAQMLRQLKELNIKVCVDDLGNGYSPLSNLHNFPLAHLKSDKPFDKYMGRTP